jgi:hypothetical protein
VVHTTGSIPEELGNLRARAALQDRTVCTVRLEKRSSIDIERKSEYMAHAVREMTRRSDRRVA